MKTAKGLNKTNFWQEPYYFIVDWQMLEHRVGLIYKMAL